MVSSKRTEVQYRASQNTLSVPLICLHKSHITSNPDTSSSLNPALTKLKKYNWIGLLLKQRDFLHGITIRQMTRIATHGRKWTDVIHNMMEQLYKWKI